MNLGRLSIGVPSCLVSGGISHWLYSEINRMGRADCVGKLRKNLPDKMALHEVGSYRDGCDPRSWRLCLLGPACSPPPWPCSSPADHPEPDPGPVAQPGVLWRPRAHNSGCAAAHRWGHGHHLEAALEPLFSLFQGKWPYGLRMSTLSEWSQPPLRSKHLCRPKE